MEFMPNSTAAPSISKSPRSSPSPAGELAGSVVPRARLTQPDRDRMFDLLSAYFNNAERVRFEADLAEKEAVVLLRDSVHGQIQGFSTWSRMELAVAGREIVAFYSGDTIVAAEFWGESLLSRLWSQTVFAEADKIAVLRPNAEVFWFLICSGYKTYRFLPVFFTEFYPTPHASTPEDWQLLLDTLGSAKFGPRYNPATGIVRFPQATPLRPGVAEITDRRLTDPMVAFFQSRNPGHTRGDELACITRISRQNVTRAGARMLRGQFGFATAVPSPGTPE